MTRNRTYSQNRQDAQLSQRDRAAGCVIGGLVFAKVEDWNWETIFYGNYKSTFNHCDIIGLKICRIWKKTQNKGYYGVQGHRGRYQSKAPVRFPIVINRHPISYRFGVIAAYCSNFGHFAFLSHPLGLRDNVRCSSWAHWKSRSGLPISVN